METAEKLVSIILPVYNGDPRIEIAIKSVVSQSYKNWELIIIDDASTDATAAIVKEFTDNDARIRYQKNEENLGIQKSLNRGLHIARGTYIARVDDDDAWIDAHKLQSQVDFLNANQEYVLIGTGVVAIDEKGREIFRHCNPALDADIRRKILAKNFFLHSTVLFRREAVLALGGYDDSEETRHVEDYDLWLKLGTVGKFANLPNYSVQLTLRSESLSSKNKISQFEKSIRIIRKYKHAYPRYLFAVIGLSLRMNMYRFFQIRPFRSLYAFLYRFYKKI